MAELPVVLHGKNPLRDSAWSFVLIETGSRSILMQPETRECNQWYSKEASRAGSRVDRNSHD
jgi:hypothetical protein